MHVTRVSEQEIQHMMGNPIADARGGFTLRTTTTGEGPPTRWLRPELTMTR
jgi:hypothetical protein